MYEVGGIFWSNQSIAGENADFKPFLITRVERNIVHFLDLCSGKVFDMNFSHLQALMDNRVSNDLYYEAPCPRTE